MTKLIKYLRPFIAMLAVVILLLFVQAQMDDVRK